MRILVTGGNGYVGRTLTRRLFREHQVAVLDNLRHGKLRFCATESSFFEFHRVDIRNDAAVRRVFDAFQPEVVIHLAALHFIPECEALPDEAISTNVLGTVSLLRACPPQTRFVFASTAAVYAAEDRPHQEDASPVGPLDVYGLTKLQAEDYVCHFANARSLDARIVRLFNVIGPGETNPHVLPAILAQVLRGVRTLRLGNCHPRRDYIHVDDAACGFAQVALTGDRRPGVDVVNLGTGKAYSVYEVVQELADVIGESLQIETDPARTRASDRPFLAAAIDKIASRYSWTPTFSLRDGLLDLWRNPDIPAELLERS